MCAGTVVAPPGPTSAEIVSVTSTSRSVALKASFDFSALINTLARIGMVLRRSTTRWTWASDRNSAARATVTFIVRSARSRGKSRKGKEGGAYAHFSQGRGRPASALTNGFGGLPGGGPALQIGGGRAARLPLSPFVLSSGRADPADSSLFLQLPLQQLDLFGQRGVGIPEIFDLAHGVQHGRVITSAGTSPDLRQRTQRERLGEIHRHLPRTHHICRAPRG